MEAPKRILVIDDDQDFNSYVQIVLEAGGYKVDTASNMTDGISLLHQHLPDLVISDVMLARALNGLSISQEMRTHERTRHIPLLMVSAIITEKDGELLAGVSRYKADAFMSKPFAPAELLQQVAVLLAESSSVQGGSGDGDNCT